MKYTKDGIAILISICASQSCSQKYIPPAPVDPRHANKSRPYRLRDSWSVTSSTPANSALSSTPRHTYPKVMNTVARLSLDKHDIRHRNLERMRFERNGMEINRSCVGGTTGTVNFDWLLPNRRIYKPSPWSHGNGDSHTTAWSPR